MWRGLFERPSVLIILLILIIVVFGWKKLPDAARSLGRSARILKSEVDEMQNDSKAKSETVKGERAETVPDNATPGSGATAASEREDAIPGEAPPKRPAQDKADTGESPYFDEQRKGQA